jgi:hypothetical protein
LIPHAPLIDDLVYRLSGLKLRARYDVYVEGQVRFLKSSLLKRAVDASFVGQVGDVSETSAGRIETPIRYDT